jgi:hypothetical protein
MQKFGKAVGAFVFAVGTFVMATPAAAQSGAEFSAGYNLLITEDESIPVGWYADVAKKVSPSLGIVGQVTGNYKSIEEAGVTVDANLHSFMGGVRFSGTSAASPFFQALVGAIRTGGSSDLLGFTVGASDTSAALQFGGGVNFGGSSSVGFRVGADYLRTLGDFGGNAFRVAAGIVVPF